MHSQAVDFRDGLNLGTEKTLVTSELRLYTHCSFGTVLVPEEGSFFFPVVRHMTTSVLLALKWEQWLCRTVSH